HGIRRKLLAGKPSFAPALVWLTAAGFVNKSGSGLPSASVSNGTLGGRLVPRRRRYCDAFTPSIRKVITLNSGPRLSVAQVASLNVLMTAAVAFFAPAGTVARLGVLPLRYGVIQSFGHWPE